MPHIYRRIEFVYLNEVFQVFAVFDVLYRDFDFLLFSPRVIRRLMRIFRRHRHIETKRRRHRCQLVDDLRVGIEQSLTHRILLRTIGQISTLIIGNKIERSAIPLGFGNLSIYAFVNKIKRRKYASYDDDDNGGNE